MRTHTPPEGKLCNKLADKVYYFSGLCQPVEKGHMRLMLNNHYYEVSLMCLSNPRGGLSGGVTYRFKQSYTSNKQFRGLNSAKFLDVLCHACKE